MPLVFECLRNGVLRVVDEADADAVVLRNVERLHAVALGKAADARFGYAGILQELRYHLRALDGEAHVDLRRSGVLVGKAGQADKGLGMLVQVPDQRVQLVQLVGADDALVDDEVHIDVERNLVDGHILHYRLGLGFDHLGRQRYFPVHGFHLAVRLADVELPRGD